MTELDCEQYDVSAGMQENSGQSKQAMSVNQARPVASLKAGYPTPPVAGGGMSDFESVLPENTHSKGWATQPPQWSDHFHGEDKTGDACCWYVNAATCPDCGGGMVRLGSCFSCPLCGYGTCGG